jgi:hypothetical protein
MDINGNTDNTAHYTIEASEGFYAWNVIWRSRLTGKMSNQRFVTYDEAVAYCGNTDYTVNNY